MTAILISPWISFSTTDDNFKRNRTSDMLPVGAAQRWRDMFMGRLICSRASAANEVLTLSRSLGSRPTDAYSEARLADSTWFSGLDHIVKDVLVWGGESEFFLLWPFSMQ